MIANYNVDTEVLDYSRHMVNGEPFWETQDMLGISLDGGTFQDLNDDGSNQMYKIIADEKGHLHLMYIKVNDDKTIDILENCEIARTGKVKQIPGALSGWVDLMIIGLRKADEHLNWKVDMNLYFNKGDGRQSVCAAGAVAVELADGWGRTDANSIIDFHQSKLMKLDRFRLVLFALDELRRGWVRMAAYNLGIKIDDRFDRGLSYTNGDPIQPYLDQLQKLSDDLKQSGL